MNAINFNKVTKNYGDIVALDNFSLNIKCGEIFSLVGLNGAGKTTAIKSLLQLCKIQNGSIKVFSGNLSLDEIGFAPEISDIPEFLTVSELLSFALSYFKKPNDPETFVLIERVIKLFEIESLKDIKISQLSKGNKQRVSLAASVVHKPRLVIFDEPASGLDPVGRNLVKKVIKDLNQEGATVLFTTHILSDVADLCDRIGIVSEGRLDFCGTPIEFCKDRPLSEIEKVFVEFETSKKVPGALSDNSSEGKEKDSKLETKLSCMLRHIWISAYMVFLKALRSNLITGVLLLMLPFIWGGWLFEQNNPGFQTGFIADSGSIFVSVFAIILTLILSFEHIYWAKEDSIPYFYLSRMKATVFSFGRFVGILSASGFAIFSMILTLILFMYFNTGSLVLYPLFIGLSVFMQIMLIVALFSFFSTFLPKLTTVSVVLILYLVGSDLEIARSFIESSGLSFLQLFFEFVFAFLPEFSLYGSEINNYFSVIFVLGYTVFQSLFYLFAGGKILSRKDL